MKRLQAICYLLSFAAFGSAKAQTAEPGGVPEVQAQPATPTQPAPKRLIRVSGGVMAGLRLSGDNPAYPAGVEAQGTVMLHAIIGEDGHIQGLTVISGFPMLATAALDAVKTWVYKPYLLNGEPIAVDTTITVHFSQSSSPTPTQAIAPHCREDWLHGTDFSDCDSTPDRLVRVSSGVMSERLISKPMPVIPPRVSTSGGVILRAIIAKNGTMQSLTLDLLKK